MTSPPVTPPPSPSLKPETPALRAAGFAYRASARIAVAASWVAALFMAGMVGLIVTEIVLRSFFGTSTHIVEEYVGYGLMTMIFLALAHTLDSGALIRVDIVLSALGPAPRRVLEILICLVSVAVVVFVGDNFWTHMVRRYEGGTVSNSIAATPLWIPEAFVCFGFALFGLQVLFYLLRLCLGGDLIRDDQEFD